MSQKIIKEIKESLNNVKISKNEVIEYEIGTLTGSETLRRSFDLVVRDSEGKIVFVSDFCDKNDFGKEIKCFEDIGTLQVLGLERVTMLTQDEINIYDYIFSKYDISMDFPFNYFLIYINERIFFDLKHRRQNSEGSLSFDVFFRNIKIEFALLMKDIDFVLKDLRNKEIEFNDLKKSGLEEIKKLKSNVEFYERLWKDSSAKASELERSIQDQKEINEIDLKFRLKLKLLEVDFLKLSNKIKDPEPYDTSKEVKYGHGDQDKVNEVMVSNNCIVNRYFTTYKEDILLKKMIYDYHAKGRVDIPEYILDKEEYYILNIAKVGFEFISHEKVNKTCWVSFSDLNKV